MLVFHFAYWHALGSETFGWGSAWLEEFNTHGRAQRKYMHFRLHVLPYALEDASDAFSYF